MDEQHIDRLDDDQYRGLVTAHLNSRTADPEIWAQLIQPKRLGRTHTTLGHLHQQVLRSLRAKKAAQEEFRQTCLTRGEAGKREWLATTAEYERWRHRAGNFAAMVQERVSQVRRVEKALNQARGDDTAHTHRMALRDLAVAVRRHQAAHAKAGGIAEQCDYELWALLDRVTVPMGPDCEPTPLRTMLDIYWADVLPIDDRAEASARHETVMRSAPAGRSGSYEGVPRARAVGSDRKLA